MSELSQSVSYARMMCDDASADCIISHKSSQRKRLSDECAARREGSSASSSAVRGIAVTMCSHRAWRVEPREDGICIFSS